MSIKSVYRLFALAAVAAAMTGVTSCTEKKFHVEGNIADAKDSTLYLENMSLNGPVAIDSVKLGDDGAFSFGERTAEAPEFYRLRIAGQIVNLAIDSTETVRVKASYPTMTTQYEVEGSDDCSKIKELALKQMDLQNRIAQIVRAPQLGVEAVDDSVAKVVAAYKDDVKVHYIFKAPMRSYAYFALFQTITLGDAQTLIFNPRSSEDDVKVFAAVATSWDTYYPEAERGGEDNQNVVADDNVQQRPTFFLISRDNAVYKRDAQVKDLDAEIRLLL